MPPIKYELNPLRYLALDMPMKRHRQNLEQIIGGAVKARLTLRAANGLRYTNAARPPADKHRQWHNAEPRSEFIHCDFVTASCLQEGTIAGFSRDPWPRAGPGQPHCSQDRTS